MDLPAMTRLQEEHHIISAVVGLIERQIAAYEDGRSLDSGLLRLALEYLRDYPEWHHHPREEHLFTLGVRKDPLLEKVFRIVRAEHDSLPDATRTLLEDLNEVDQGAAADKIVKALRVYAAEQRKHMVREDHDIFPRLRGLLDASAWALSPAESSRPGDPLVGGGDAGRFRPLRDAIAG